jgi:hypothetical protein
MILFFEVSRFEDFIKGATMMFSPHLNREYMCITAQIVSVARCRRGETIKAPAWKLLRGCGLRTFKEAAHM